MRGHRRQDHLSNDNDGRDNRRDENDGIANTVGCDVLGNTQTQPNERGATEQELTVEMGHSSFERESTTRPWQDRGDN